MLNDAQADILADPAFSSTGNIDNTATVAIDYLISGQMAIERYRDEEEDISQIIQFIVQLDD